MTSLSRKFAKFVADLTYDQIPADVVDRAKGVTLQAMVSAVVGQNMEPSRSALEVMVAEEGDAGGVATVLGYGVKLTKGGAAFVNSEMICIGGKWDTFRMLTHPGTAIIPAALTAAEVSNATGREFLTAVVAAYEVMERMASEFIPTVMARGFHASPVFGIFGAAIAVAKIQKFNEEQINSTIGQCVNLASGNLEGGRGGSARALREGAAVRNAFLAVALGRTTPSATETSLEGDAGFYHSYAGNNRGDLTYSFTAHKQADLAAIADGLGAEWIMRETLFRIYSTSGYNIAHIDIIAALCADHKLTYDEIDRIEAQVNWFETEYPSPEFPRPLQRQSRFSTRYFAAYAAVLGRLPLDWNPEKAGKQPIDPRITDLMKRVTLVPVVRRTLFGPRITVFTKDGRTLTTDGTGREFIWAYDELARRLQPIVPDIDIGPEAFRKLVELCGSLNGSDRPAKHLIDLTMTPQ